MSYENENSVLLSHRLLNKEVWLGFLINKSMYKNFIHVFMVALLIPLSLLADDTYSKIGIRHLEML